jgi:hypothetical protein
VDVIELHIPSKQQIIQSKVVSTDNCEVGVSFESIATFADPSPGGDDELSVRMGKLEDEISALKQMLKRLQKQIERTEAA